MNELSLFSGAGGGCLASVLLGHRIVGYVEKEPYAQEVLKARIADGCLDAAPIFGDIRAFLTEGYAASYQGLVDVVSGGFPCQDISDAGKRAGIGGERSGLWKSMRDIVGVVRPRFVFVENVSALVNRGLDVVLADLAGLGFDAEWDLFRASDVGAPHRRERVFILAGRCLSDSEPDGWQQRQDERNSRVVESANGTPCRERTAQAVSASGGCNAHGFGADGAQNDLANPDEAGFGILGRSTLLDRIGQASGDDAHGCGSAGCAVALPSRDGRIQGRAESERIERGPDAAERCGTVADAGNVRRERCAAMAQELEIGWAELDTSCCFPPGPSDAGAWRDYIAEGGPVPAVRRGSPGLANRVDRLRALGNGQVPVVAALAFRTLAARLQREAVSL